MAADPKALMVLHLQNDDGESVGAVGVVCRIPREGCRRDIDNCSSEVTDLLQVRWCDAARARVGGLSRHLDGRNACAAHANGGRVVRFGGVLRGDQGESRLIKVDQGESGIGRGLGAVGRKQPRMDANGHGFRGDRGGSRWGETRPRFLRVAARSARGVAGGTPALPKPWRERGRVWEVFQSESKQIQVNPSESK